MRENMKDNEKDYSKTIFIMTVFTVILIVIASMQTVHLAKGSYGEESVDIPKCPSGYKMGDGDSKCCPIGYFSDKDNNICCDSKIYGGSIDKGNGGSAYSACIYKVGLFNQNSNFSNNPSAIGNHSRNGEVWCYYSSTKELYMSADYDNKTNSMMATDSNKCSIFASSWFGSADENINYRWDAGAITSQYCEVLCGINTTHKDAIIPTLPHWCYVKKDTKTLYDYGSYNLSNSNYVYYKTVFSGECNTGSCLSNFKDAGGKCTLGLYFYTNPDDDGSKEYKECEDLSSGGAEQKLYCSFTIPNSNNSNSGYTFAGWKKGTSFSVCNNATTYDLTVRGQKVNLDTSKLKDGESYYACWKKNTPDAASPSPSPSPSTSTDMKNVTFYANECGKFKTGTSIDNDPASICDEKKFTYLFCHDDCPKGGNKNYYNELPTLNVDSGKEFKGWSTLKDNAECKNVIENKVDKISDKVKDGKISFYACCVEKAEEPSGDGGGSDGGGGGGYTPSDSTPTVTPDPSSEADPTLTPTSNGGGNGNDSGGSNGGGSNPQTGPVGTIIAWIIGIMAFIYVMWYIKRTSDV